MKPTPGLEPGTDVLSDICESPVVSAFRAR
jgi:hypothetical protein